MTKKVQERQEGANSEGAPHSKEILRVIEVQQLCNNNYPKVYVWWRLF